MWTLLDSLARPPLLQALQAGAGSGDQACLRYLAHRAPSARATADAMATVMAGAACWHVLAAALPVAERRALRGNLRTQRRLLAPLLGPVAQQRTLSRRAMARLRAALKARRRWAAALAVPLPEHETVLRQAVERTLVRDGRRLARDPRSKRGWRALRRQQGLLAALGVSPRVGGRGTLADLAAANGELQRLLAEDTWLRALSAAPGPGRRRGAALARRRRRVLRRHIQAQARACEVEPERLAAALAWQVFLAGVAQPASLRPPVAGAAMSVTGAAALAAVPPGGGATPPAAAAR